MFIWKGNKLQIAIFGTSHAEKIGVEIKGFPKESFDGKLLEEFLSRRKPTQNYGTLRKEADTPVFECGVNDGKITGEIRAVISNGDVQSKDYSELYGKPRPSHADYAAYAKDGRLDFCGGGEFSGRMTAPLCIAGGIAKQLLQQRSVAVEGYVSQVGKVKGKSYKTGSLDKIVRQQNFPSLSRSGEMLQEIFKAHLDGNSVGGIVECVVFGFPRGIGGALFDGLEGKIANVVYAIPAVKGVEFGSGFQFAEMLGSQANDAWQTKDGKVFSLTNNSGGINGGISNGMPLTLAVAFRPTPSIGKVQNTVDLVSGSNVQISVSGRHDACIVPRAVPVVEAAVSLALLDSIL